MGNNKAFSTLVLILFIFGLPACNTPILASTPVPTSTTTKPTAAPSKTAIVLPNSLVQPTSTATGGSSPDILWNDALGKPIVIEGFKGLWSPVADELAGILQFEIGDCCGDTGTLGISSQPGFTYIALDEDNKQKVVESLNWSPDGQKILYGIAVTSGGLGDMSYSNPWIIDRNGENSRIIIESTFQALEFSGWLDTARAVFVGYAGGQGRKVAVWNIATGQLEYDEVVESFDFFPFHNNMIPATYGSATNQIYVITPGKINSDPSMLFQPLQSTHIFPYEKGIYPYSGGAFFQDWQPGVNVMLVIYQGWLNEKEQVDVSDLLLWNLDTDQVSTLIPGGLSGHFTPDGRNLVYVTAGPYSQFEPSMSGTDALTQVDLETQPFLQVMDFPNRQVWLSLPIIAERYTWLYPDGVTEAINLSLSPDSRYMTFMTQGKPSLDGNGLPGEVTFIDTKKSYFNILDMWTKQLIYSEPLDIKLDLDKIIWSPSSKYFVYQGVENNWQLFNVENGDALVLTFKGNTMVGSPAWSYDGRYLSFIRDEKTGQWPYATYILNMANLPNK